MKQRRISLLTPILLLLLLTPLLRAPAPAQAAGAVSRILLDGEVLIPRDANGKQVTPFVQDGTTYLPVRALGDAFGMDIAWDQDSNAAYVGVPTDAGAPQKQIRVYVDGNLLQPKDVNGKSVPPIAREGTVYLPVRALSQALGCSVAWDQGTRTVTLYSENTYRTEPYRLIFMGDWSLAKNQATVQENIREMFTIAAKPFSRWGMGGLEPRTVPLVMKKDFSDEKIESTHNSAAYTQASWSTVFCSAEIINRETNYAHHIIHEFTHCLQPYNASSAWWREHLADYSRFRYYYTPSGAANSATAAELRDWKWTAYGHCEWFFTWLDQKYPTRQTGNGLEMGLLDRLQLGFLYGQLKSDGGKTHTDADVNAIVRAYTGASNLEELRKRYVQELDSGAWKFTGYANMEDSFLEKATDIKVETVSSADNLLRGARMLGDGNGFPGAYTGSALTDSDVNTLWERPDFSKERLPYAVWDLGEKKDLTSVSLLGNFVMWDSGSYPAGWDLLVSSDGKAWTTAVSCRNATRVTTSLSFPQVSGRYVMLRLAEPAAGGSASIREFMVFGPKAVAADNTTISSGKSLGTTWTARTRDGLADGSGRAVGPDGIYIGSFSRGERQGPGFLYQDDGSTLEGCWSHDVICGPGRYTLADGRRIIGTWENGQLQGNAWEVRTDGSVLEQTWDHGTLQSSAPMARTTWEDGYTYEGYRIQGKAEGYGKRSYGGATYEGTFSDGQPFGNGKMTYSNGDTFTGTWAADGVAEGTYRNPNGASGQYRLVGGQFKKM